ATDLADFCAEICAEAPNTPFYYYHSGMSGVSLDMCDFMPIAAAKIPTFKGVKYNWNDLYAYQRCVALDGGKYDITWGVDEVYAGSLAYGSLSAVGSTYNYMAPVYTEMKEAFEAGNMAKVDELSKKVLKVIDILVEFGGVQAGKAIMAIHGIDLGTARRPLRPLTAEQKQTIVERYKAIWA
ncbi:MAG: dihydrodipicolinate synthase family protein, partial [Lentisphaeria bacterium]